jgi:4-hydroxybenzoate polyprenyltransferase
MFALLSQRLLPALQLTRMAMVFTAIADGLCALFLQAQRTRLAVDPNAPIGHFIDMRLVAAMVLISIGLYGYGMALNDLIDHRRDRQLAASRPIPSGRITPLGARLLCGLLAALALLGGVAFALRAGNWQSLLLVASCGSLISLYDFAAKYLVGPGLLTLGLIRFFHALIPAADVPLLWHPLLLLDHFTLLATLAYVWGEKRPSLTRLHAVIVGGGLILFNAVCVALLLARTGADQMGLQWGLLLPLGCAVLFILLAAWLYRAGPTPRQAGQRLMRLGTLWLILYDAAFVGGYVSWTLAGLILLLLPAAWVGTHLVRGWSNLISLSRRPAFRRAELE